MTFANRKTPGHGAIIADMCTTLCTKFVPRDAEGRVCDYPPLAIDEGEIAAEMSASEQVNGRVAVWVWLSSGVGFLWSRDPSSGFKGYR